MNRLPVAAACGLAFLAGPAWAGEKTTLELKLVANKEAVPWPHEQRPKDFDASLQDLIQKKKKGEAVRLPPPPAVDLLLRITNTGKEKTTVYVDGDPNVTTLTVKGPGVVTVEPGLATTAEFRTPRAVVLQPGKSHDIPAKQLADGFRGAGRYVYVTAPGEYTITATYQLATAEGAKGPVLKSGEVKVRIEDPK
jgi:hypothetical protein